jgi:hypothetical protein
VVRHVSQVIAGKPGLLVPTRFWTGIFRWSCSVCLMLAADPSRPATIARLRTISGPREKNRHAIPRSIES